MSPTDPRAPPRPKPCRFAHAPAQLEAGRTRVMLDLPDEQLGALVKFLTETLKGRPYT
ncbi:MAG: hypothetical protein ACRYFR_04815 [Janthinobacterium lividum]